MKVVSDGMSINYSIQNLSSELFNKMSVVVFLNIFFSNIRGFFLFNFLFLCEIAEAIPFSFLYFKILYQFIVKKT